VEIIMRSYSYKIKGLVVSRIGFEGVKVASGLGIKVFRVSGSLKDILSLRISLLEVSF
jgi:hypothetical protein